MILIKTLERTNTTASQTFSARGMQADQDKGTLDAVSKDINSSQRARVLNRINKTRNMAAIRQALRKVPERVRGLTTSTSTTNT